MNDIVCCCIVKNENVETIFEWIDYHSKIGITKFVIYDHSDIKSLKFDIQNSIYTKIVEIVDWSLQQQAQNKAYNHCLKSNIDATWIIFIDIDEFIHIENNEKIDSFLSRYNQYAAVCLNWIIYTANNHISKPLGDLFSNYTEQLDHLDNKKIKSIVQPKSTVGFSKNPHLPEFIANNYGVDIKENIVNDPNENFVYKNIYIKHFITKSFEEWLLKLNRGRANYPINYRQKIDLFWDYNPKMLPQKEYIYELFHNKINNYQKKNYKFL